MKNCDAWVPGNHDAGNAKRKRFKVYRISQGVDIQPVYTRRDFGKIYLITGNALIHSEGIAIQTSAPILFFEPLTPYSLQEVSGNELSFACLFSRNLLECDLWSSVYQQLMRFAGTSGPVFFHLDGKQKKVIAGIFEQIMLEQDASYQFRHELFCNYMNLILHEVLKEMSSKISGYPSFHLN